MPAHAVPIDKPRCAECHRPATVIVRNAWNAEIGPRCTRCATRTIERLNSELDRQIARYGKDT